MEFNKLNFKKNNFFAIDSEEKNNGNVKPEDNFKKSEKNIFETSDENYMSYDDCMSEKEIAEMKRTLDISRDEYDVYIKSNLDSAIEKINKKTTAKGANTLVTIKNYTEENCRVIFDDIAEFYPSEKDEIFADIIRKIDEPKAMTKENASNPCTACKILTTCIENGSDASLDFVEKFIDNCSEDSLNAILKKGNLDKYANFYVPNSPLSTKLTEMYLDVRGKLNDGKIENSKQGNIGDCWLLSGINAMRYSEKGQEILNEHITETENGYNVRFEGLNKDIEITKQEIIEAVQSYKYSIGDSDVLLYELAFEKALSDTKKNDSIASNKDSKDENESSIDGGDLELFISSLTGKKTEKVSNSKGCGDEGYVGEKVLDAFLEIIKPLIGPVEYVDYLGNILDKIGESDNIIATVAFVSKENKKARYLTDVNGEKHRVSGVDSDSRHACAIKSVGDDLVTLINPWNSSKDIVVTKQEFLDNAIMISYCDLSEE